MKTHSKATAASILGLPTDSNEPPTPAPEPLKAGDAVRHAQFGAGVIVELLSPMARVSFLHPRGEDEPALETGGEFSLAELKATALGEAVKHPQTGQIGQITAIAAPLARVTFKTPIPKTDRVKEVTHELSLNELERA